MANPSVISYLNTCYLTSIDLVEFIDMCFFLVIQRSIKKKFNRVIHCKLVREDGKEALHVLAIHVT